jgi:Ca-activated chloride channel family protein
VACALVSLCALFILPATLRAQSGRQRPAPSASPTPAQRPRRAVPVTDESLGQPPPSASPVRTGETQTPQTNTATPPAAKPATDAPTDIDDDEVYKVDSNLVPVSANVTDATGHAVADLKLEDFELRVDGQPKAISDISHAETPVRIALLFDNSSSIRPTRELEKQAAINFFRTVIRPIDQAAIFSISTIPTLDQPLTNEVPKLVRTIEHYGEVEGSTALFDTVVMAADYLRPQPGRKVMIIVSDGVETTSNLQDFGEMVRRVLASDCQVFVIQTGLSANANLRDLVAERRMQDLTSYTGGFVNVPKLPSDLEVAFTQIAADLAQQYVLSYYPNDDARDGRFRIITVRVKSRPNVRVRARRGYYPRQRDNLSALQPPDTNATNAAPFAIRDPIVTMPTAASAQRDIAQQGGTVVASNANARPPVNLNAPTHGSKNLDPDADETPPADAASTRPAVRLGTFKPEQSPPADQPAPLKSQTENSQPDSTQSFTPTQADGAKDSKAAPQTESAPSSSTPNSSTQNSSTQNSSTPTSSPKNGTAQSPPQSAQHAASPASSPPPAQAGEPPKKTTDVVSGGVLNSRAKSLPVPLYPELAKRMRASGMVVVEVLIDESGKVVEARATSGPSSLREAAVNAARQARFSPTLVSGQPVRVMGFINYTFTL